MKNLTAITGGAGAGKTTRLIDKAVEMCPSLIQKEHQALLVITRMHGARRRLEAKLREAPTRIPLTVRTVDSFALWLVNRWRRSVGFDRVVTPTQSEQDFLSSPFAVEAGFAQIRKQASILLASPTIKAVIAETYPLMVIDEFQDCHADMLDLLRALADVSTLLVAADEFQMLDSSVSGCPALDWLEEMVQLGRAELVPLTGCWRTENQPILNAARALRDNLRSSERTVPVVLCPSAAVAAWKVAERLLPSPKRWSGSVALICPSRDPFVRDVTQSLEQQLLKRKFRAPRWNVEVSADEECIALVERVCHSLGVAGVPDRRKGEASLETNQRSVDSTIKALRRHAKLRGVTTITFEMVDKQTRRIFQERRAHSAGSSKWTVTTVHGAKNREFDNVFVLWTYLVPSDASQRRKLLYNAITRSKQQCMVLYRGDEKRANKDGVIQLLGPPVAAFPRKAKQSLASAKKRKA